MVEDFDAVSWMRKRRAEIDTEDAGLDWEGRGRRTLESLQGDSLWEHLKGRILEPASATPKSSRRD